MNIPDDLMHQLHKLGLNNDFTIKLDVTIDILSYSQYSQ